MELIDKKRLKEYLEAYKTCFTWNDGGRELALLKRISAHVEKTPIKAVSCGLCEYYDPIKSQCTHRLGLRGHLNKYTTFCSFGRWNYMSENAKTDIEKLNDSIKKLKDASDSYLDSLKSYNEKLKSILEDVKTW